MEYNFFALISRMKYIDRWALMKNSREENLCEHSLEVSMISHALATIGNVRYGKNLNAEKAALIGLYHDASEIITGDMPTPVKYYNDQIKNAFKDVEDIACHTLLEKLPEDLRPAYEDIFFKNTDNDGDIYLWKLIKAADKLSALIKCMEETNSGNTEFSSAMSTIMTSVSQLSSTYPEVNDFVCQFLPAYGKTLDELQAK
ncbi:MAG: 5'-deoxynucleotidase [Coprococcus sp.]|nr:5'-deoxynucleotidase [Coprococcus sp.]